MAVAGFARQDIEIEFANDTLTIRGSTSEDNSDYLFKGIATRNFTRTFALNDQIEIKDATLFNGLLQVACADTERGIAIDRVVACGGGAGVHADVGAGAHGEALLIAFAQTSLKRTHFAASTTC